MGILYVGEDWLQKRFQKECLMLNGYELKEHWTCQNSETGKQTVMGDTVLCQKYYLILKDVQLPKTSLPESHCMITGTWNGENSKVVTGTKKL